MRRGRESYLVISYPLTRPRNFAALTQAELETTELALQGLSYKEMAAARGVKVRTIANQLASAYKKLGIGSLAELAALARGDSPLRAQRR
jgi:DNA-binding CsgD family transcriptional regulator